MNVHHILAAEVPAELPHRLEEGQAFDIADGAPDLHYAEVFAFSRHQDAALDLVGYMRNHLHGRAEISAVAFLLDNGVVDLAGRAIVETAHRRLHETLIVPEIKIGFGAVVGDKNLAML